MDSARKKVLAVFAHPDDESFGPGGTLALWAREGAEIYMLLATNGDHDKIGHIREEEVKEAAKVLGISRLNFLSFQDGYIGNHDLQALEVQISEKVREFQPDIILTFHTNGLSGHLDHIAVASAVTQTFRKTKIATKLYYYTLPKNQSDQMQDYFIFFPNGIDPQEADEAIDITSVWPTRLEAMSKHESQIHDMKKFISILGDTRVEYFMTEAME